MRKVFILIFVISTLLAAFYLWWFLGLKAVNTSNKNQVIFVVQKGKGVREIANKLKQEELIKDPVVFFLLIKKLGLDGKIQAGDFRLSPSMSAQDIANALTHGTVDEWITIPEGKRADEIADMLKAKIPTYEESWRDLLNKNEGYLFPDTYLIPKDTDINLILSIMKNNFEKKIASIPNIDKSNLSKKEIITVASLVEREAKLAKDRPLVASVILNRYDISMPLQIDATIQYALGFQKSENTWWKKALTITDLKIDSPYNTYLHTGLPPTPIANPGFEVINSVVNPAQTDYLYYISDSTGQNHYAKTLNEHNANIKKYGLQ
ncbi:endolytic transglycosylase MltG [Candidatus Microgenomates bacterium]|nr:MAG: endolytic transglycosylase MltG [Candidatus Microgenomates bacterium]